MILSIFRTKNLRGLLAEIAAQGEDRKLRRSLTALDITLLGLGVMIGTGIFVLTGIVAAGYDDGARFDAFLCARRRCLHVRLSRLLGACVIHSGRGLVIHLRVCLAR